MYRLHIDIETYSPVDLSECGVYRYAADPGFQILLFAYAWGDDPVQVVDLASGETIPDAVLTALDDPNVQKWAFNASFERTCIGAWLGRTLDPAGWYCTMVDATAAGYQLNLAETANALGVKQGKIEDGKRLIRVFSTPHTPTKRNGWKTQTLPYDRPEDWERFKEYCARDVEVERDIWYALPQAGRLRAADWAQYWEDQRVNDRGIAVDLPLARGAIETDEAAAGANLGRMARLTGLDNPNSAAQLKAWLAGQGVEVSTLGKEQVAALLEQDLPADVAEVLRLRLETSKSSTKKYLKVLSCAGDDSRARGLLQFYGSRTGRWAGRLIQVQNLPRQGMKQVELGQARDLVRTGNGEIVGLLWDSPATVLSELVRTVLVPAAGREFLVADYSAIEARVIAWLAGENWVLDLFEAGGDIYCETGTRMFGQPVTKKSPLRQKAKVAVLACGYGGGVGALRAMGAAKMGIPETELQGLVDAWRGANPSITGLWRQYETAAQAAIKGAPAQVGQIRFTTYTDPNGLGLAITLPSGRALTYPGVRLEQARYGYQITHLGVNTARKWGRLATYGGKLTENIVQAVARDLLAEAITRLHKAGYPVVMHVHDEVICEVRRDSPHHDLADMTEIMAETPTWAEDLPLAAEGFTTNYYRKG